MNTTQLLEVDEINRLVSIVNDLDHISIVYKYFLDEDLIVKCRNELVDLINHKKRMYEV